MYDQGETFEAWQTEAQIRILLWQKRIHILQQFRETGTLLDVGTGDGFFLAQLGPEYRAMGTEISAAGCQLARSRGAIVHHGDFREIEGRFDIITLWHVLEHVPQPGAFLEDLRGYLEPGGLLLIAVPNENLKQFRFRLARQIGRVGDDSQFEPVFWGSEVHLNFFTLPVLKHKLQSAGFNILSTGVDDVYLDRSLLTRSSLRLNQLGNGLFGSHLARAMYLVCQS